MKFKTTDLISRIDAILAIQEAEQHAKQEESEAKEYEARQQWIFDHSEAFGRFARDIIAAIRDGQPVTNEGVPASIKGRFNNDLKFYSAPSQWGTDDRQAKSLKKLRNALQASQEDTVSPTAIKQLGFQDVTFLFTESATTN